MYESNCDTKNIFLEKLHLTRRGKCLPNPNDEKKLSEISKMKYARQLLDRSCDSKCSDVASLGLECSSALCPVVKLKDVYSLLQNGKIQLSCLSSSLDDEMIMTCSCALDISSTIFQPVHCKCNITKRQLQNRTLSQANTLSVVDCDCNTKEKNDEMKPIMADYKMIDFDLTSELGKRKLVGGHHRYGQNKGSRVHLVTSSYERFCNQSSKIGNVSSRLRVSSGSFPIVYQQNREIADCDVHKYHFTKQQRYEFCKQIDLKLKYNVMPCVVLIPMLSQMKLLLLSQKKLGMCRVRLQCLSERTLSAWRGQNKYTTRRRSARLREEMKRHTNKQLKNCFVCLNQLPPHLITKCSSTCMPRLSCSVHSVPSGVMKSCCVSLCELSRHMIC